MDTFQLPAGTKMGHVHLLTTNVDRLLLFYVDLLGFNEIKRENKSVYLSAGQEISPLLILTENKNAVPRVRQNPGLFHTAILVPTRFALAQLLQRLFKNNLRLGFGDHGVSEAIYLSDPDGNGVELYADRPREQWPIINGQIEMYTDPVDKNSVLNELNGKESSWHGIASGTVIGHVHLQVSDLIKAERFYHELIGFDITQQSYPGALFVSAGGYHHHLGLNTWYSKNSRPAPENSTGLLSYSIQVPDKQTLTDVKKKLETGAVAVESVASGLLTTDFDGITIHLETQQN